jgi:hypothetical protein
MVFQVHNPGLENRTQNHWSLVREAMEAPLTWVSLSGCLTPYTQTLFVELPIRLQVLAMPKAP